MKNPKGKALKRMKYDPKRGTATWRYKVFEAAKSISKVNPLSKKK